MLVNHRLAAPLGVCVIVCLIWSTHLLGATVGFELRIGGGKNAPIFHVLNESTSASITRFAISIGDDAFNYDDFTIKTLTTANYTASSVDEADGGARSDVLSFDFNDFGPGKAFRVKTDIDIDDLASKENYNQILFQLGGNDESDNALVSVNFSDGTLLSGHLPDYESKPDGSYIYSLSRRIPGNDSDDGGNDTPAIPLPPGLWAGLGLLGGLGAIGLARKTFRRIH